jgi:hypothetical protein
MMLVFHHFARGKNTGYKLPPKSIITPNIFAKLDFMMYHFLFINAHGRLISAVCLTCFICGLSLKQRV